MMKAENVIKAGLSFPLLAAVARDAISAKTETPMDYLETHGPAADPVTALNWGLLSISVLVVVIITALVLYAALRKRPPLPQEQDGVTGKLPVMPDRGGMAWIYIGVGISTLVLLGSTVWTLKVLSAVSRPPNAALTVEVVAHQWWWEARYRRNGSSQILVTANEFHIPVGEPVRFRLESPDVIHSFWVPKLGGKTDMIPGQINYAWLQADKAGEYRGQCAEFCGPQHANMALHVLAQDGPAFEAWWQAQLRDSALPEQAGQAVQRGRALFLERCATCHTVRGTQAGGGFGPDLTHLMSRRRIAAGMLPNTSGSLHGWVADAQSIKPGVRMPSFKLSPEDLHALVDYLKTLE